MKSYHLKICIVSEFPPPSGGIAQQARNLYESLKCDNLDVSKIDQNGYLNTRFGRLCQIPYLKTICAFLYIIMRLIKEVPKIDVAHIMSSSYWNFFLFTMPSVLIAKFFRKVVIIHYHGGAASDFLITWEYPVRLVVKLSDYILFPSEFLLNVFKRFQINGIVVPNILNLSLYKFHKRNEFKPNCIVTRHLRPEYNVECVIKAFSIIKSEYSNARLTVVGDGPEKSNLMALANKLDCEDAVFFLGRVDNERMPELYRNADFFLNASWVDNMPVSVMEAFSCGCPVVTTKAGGIPYMIEHRETGFLVDLNDHKRLAQEVLWALSNQKKIAYIADNASKQTLKYSWPEVRKKLFKLYER